jgi:hypothetical protein
VVHAAPDPADAARPNLAPGRVAFFTADDLRAAITRAGFEIVEDWRPGPRSALFLVARKPA